MMFGLYIHVPFCNGKCPYCDFYSLSADGDMMDMYLSRMKEEISLWAKKAERVPDTVYFGGGTPSLLGARRLSELMAAVKREFALAENAQVTLEANPGSTDFDFFAEARAAGFNRLSMGMQSADEGELKLLGRKHSPEDAERAVRDAKKAGFEDISLDLMIALPYLGGESREEKRARLLRSIDRAAGTGVTHISAYILKIEPGTAFAGKKLRLPDEDESAEEYLFAAEKLEERGYAQYEISNFSRPGFESRHNLIYWRCEEYLGIGPAAHGFFKGERYFYPRDLDAFLKGEPPCGDGEGGDFEEFVMLRLRLREGVTRQMCKERFGSRGQELFERVRKNAASFPPELAKVTEDSVSLTPRGFLLSNTLIERALRE